jgi:peptidyl-prolyl cis-trans isomerase B (cyclophilin B)
MNRRTSASLVVFATVLLVALMVLPGCTPPASTSTTGGSTSASSEASGSASTSPSVEPTSPAAVNANGVPLYTPKYQPNGNEIGVIKTNKGTIKVKFYSGFAPIATANFIELAQKGFYNGVKFSRFSPGYLIQGGDPKTKSASSKAVAAAAARQTHRFDTGGPGYAIRDEFANSPITHVDGALALARPEMPNGSGSQFYFALTALPNLDHQYTVFGQTTSGLDVVHKLKVGDVIKSVTIENASK